MSRHFIAIPLPAALKNFLALLRPASFPGGRLVPPEQMHITLHFLGELHHHDVVQVERIMTELSEPIFELEVSGLGCFPNCREPRVLWAGVSPNSNLLRLHRKLEKLLEQAIGYEAEARAFRPHVTLVRIRRKANLDRLASYFDSDLSRFQKRIKIQHVALIRSHNRDDGSVSYQTICEKKLEPIAS